MKCQLCGKGEAGWQCKVCRKVVCDDCVRVTNDGVFCEEHAPTNAPRMPGGAPPVVAPATRPALGPPTKKEEGEKRTSNSFRAILLTLIILDIGLAIIVLITNHFIDTMSIPFAQDYIRIFQTFGLNILYGIVGLTFGMFVLYVISAKLHT